MVKLIEFEEDLPVSEEMVEDLRVINADLPPKPETLTDSPFNKIPAKKKKAPVFKPPPPVVETTNTEPSLELIAESPEPPIYIAPLSPPPQPENVNENVKKIKPKRPLTEKQKSHLERIRKKKVEKAQAKIQKTIEKNDIVKTPEQPTPISEEEIMDMEKDEFENWLKYMDKFDKMCKSIAAENQRKADEINKKEKEIEDRIRKKIELENRQRQNINKPIYEENILEQQAPPQTDYGQYSGMFGY